MINGTRDRGRFLENVCDWRGGVGGGGEGGSDNANMCMLVCVLALTDGSADIVAQR